MSILRNVFARRPYAAALLLVTLAALPTLRFVFDAQWMWIDDQLVFDRQLWPLYSEGQLANRAQGRDFTWHGLYYEAVGLLFGRAPVSYYFATFVLQYLLLAAGILLVAASTGSTLACLIFAVTAMLSSTGPEVFLTLTKSELRLSLFFILMLLSLTQLLRTDGREAVGFALLLVTTVLSGILGKETFLILPIALLLVTGLAFILRRAFTLECRRRLLLGSIAACAGMAVVFAQRWYFGVAGAREGSYTAMIMSQGFDLAPILGRFQNYLVHLQEFFALWLLALLLCLGTLLFAAVRRRPLDAATVIGVVALIASTGYMAMLIGLVTFVTVYYMFPPAMLTSVALACLIDWRQIRTVEGPRSAVLGILAQRGVGLVAVVLAILAAPLTLLRLHTQSYVRSADASLFQALSRLPRASIVALPFQPDAEMVGNLSLLMRDVLQRGDLVIRALPMAGETAAAPHYAVLLHDLGENWMLGVRGAAHGPRARQLALFTASGTTLDCPVMQQVRPPDRWRVWRLGTSMLVDFTYSWEIHRVNRDGDTACG